WVLVWEVGELFGLSRVFFWFPFSNRSPANVLSPALRARSSPPKPRLFPIAPWPARPCDPASPIYPPANHENPQPRSSTRAAPIHFLHALRAPSSFAAQIPAGYEPYLSPNHALPATDPGAAKPVAVSAAGMPDNCSSGICPASVRFSQSQLAPDLGARNHTPRVDSPASAHRSIAPCNVRQRDDPSADAAD